MRKITEQTLIPISLIIVLGGIIWWAASIDKRVSASEIDIMKVEACGKEIDAKFGKIQQDLAVIKDRLGVPK